MWVAIHPRKTGQVYTTLYPEIKVCRAPVVVQSGIKKTIPQGPVVRGYTLDVVLDV